MVLRNAPHRVLVTNDDGVFAPGLAVLAATMAELGHEVVVAAPNREMSGSSSAMGALAHADHLAYESVVLSELPEVEAFAIDGPPAACVIAGALGAFGPVPDVVVAGINPGNNCGRSTLHSGTVGAALTAANWGISAMAVSIGTGEVVHWATAASYAQAALGSLLDAPARTVVNLNVPNVGASEVRGIRPGKLALYGTVRTVITGRSAGRIHIGQRRIDEELAPDTDTALVRDGYVSVTFLRGPSHLDDVEVWA